MNLEPAISAYQAGASIREAAGIAGCSHQWMHVVLTRAGLVRRGHSCARGPLWIVLTGARRQTLRVVRARTFEGAIEQAGVQHLKRTRVVRWTDAHSGLKAEATEKGVWV